MDYITHTDGIEGMKKLIKENIENNNLLRNLNSELIHELNAAGLLKPIIKRRVELLIESQLQREGKTREGFYNNSFSPRVENFFLEKKEKNETIDFKLLRNKNKNIMLEAHQRLVNKENKWVELSDQWGIEPENRLGGKLLNIRQSKLSNEILQILKHTKEGRISEVFRTGKEYAIVELVKWNEIKLTNEVEKQLQQEMANEWIDELSEEIANKCLEDIETNQKQNSSKEQ